MASRTRQAAANVALLFGSTIVMLLILEVGVRIFRPQPLAAVSRSARLGWLHTPNTTIVFERDEFRVPVTFSSAGLRDREFTFEKPADVFRIAMLGDSFVEALQVPLDSCAAKRLELALNTGACPKPAGKRVEVINFGVSGYGTCQQLLLLEELVLRFEPDLVVSQFYFNDLDDDRRFGVCSRDAQGRAQVAPAPRLSLVARVTSAGKSFLRQRSHLWMFVTLREPRVLDLRRADPAVEIPPHAAGAPSASAVRGCPGRHDTLEWRLTLLEPPDDVEKSVALYAEILRRMDELSRERGARFVAVLGVSKTETEPDLYARTLAHEGCDPSAHSLEVAVTRLLDAADLRGVPMVDLAPAFRAASASAPLHFRIDGHWNAAGHRVAAAALCRALAEHGMLDPVRP